jgi:hypothetical protein
MSEFEVLDSIWFTSNIIDDTATFKSIGIVIGENATGERKAYIIDDTATWGAPFPLDAAYELFKHLKPDQNQ